MHKIGHKGTKFFRYTQACAQKNACARAKTLIYRIVVCKPYRAASSLSWAICSSVGIGAFSSSPITPCGRNRSNRIGAFLPMKSNISARFLSIVSASTSPGRHTMRTSSNWSCFKSHRTFSFTMRLLLAPVNCSYRLVPGFYVQHDAVARLHQFRVPAEGDRTVAVQEAGERVMHLCSEGFYSPKQFRQLFRL